MHSEAVRRTDAAREVLTPTVYHIPDCPFSQRLEILLSLKDIHDRLRFHVVDITGLRFHWLMEKTGTRRHGRGAPSHNREKLLTATSAGPTRTRAAIAASP